MKKLLLIVVLCSILVLQVVQVEAKTAHYKRISFEVSTVTGINGTYVFANGWVLDRQKNVPKIGDRIVILYRVNNPIEIMDDEPIKYYIKRK